ncbi:type VI secretion system protein TssA [Alcaligenes faecalis]|jgi:type VI secretion system protein ImpA|uniref:Type VI secretion system protein TssA n=2 Tax=Alcaligenes ammonioxydans TaxID=2582914 RepID=A0ABX8SWD7_9BURK|nr:type VI secretion system ImpA family N-terminal domain-containing protein [Alcaligenes ammonioxydans]QXX80341.1 type VI secretion system protein TssA [Alcaligenes ammonioxydans]WGQ35306.1 type VI secretion system ImpA family N-terminal domain-containing protein [Alcaligenes faecalis]HRL21953.1 type VI secretion system ImpA family N-terminal domain-containing protein [Alcaligenes sp.]
MVEGMQEPWQPAWSVAPDKALYGENLEYEADFLALMQALHVQGEQQFGQTIIPAQVPDWTRIVRLVQDLLDRSADIRLLVVLAQARLQTGGLPALVDVCQWLLGALQEGWEYVHPRLYEDGELDPLPRVNALAGLSAIDGLGRLMREAPVVSLGHRQLNLREVGYVLDGGQKDSGLPGRDRLVEELRRAFAAGQSQTQALRRLRQFRQELEALVRQHLETEWALRLDGAWDTVEAASAVLDAATSPSAPLAPEPIQESATSTVTLSSGRPSVPPMDLLNWQSLHVSSREEVVLLLDKLVAYFEQYEPSHPAPLLLRRAQQLVPMGFHELIRDLAPGAWEQIQVFMPRSEAASAAS